MLNLLIVAFRICLSGLFPSEYRQPEIDQSQYNVRFYHLDLNVSDSAAYIEGSVTIIIEPETPGLQQIVFDCSAQLKMDSVFVNHQPASFSHALDELTIETENLTEEPVTVKIFYHGPDRLTVGSSGIYNKVTSSWNKRITWTLSEPFSAKNWFPCKQSLTDKADSVYVFLSTDKGLKAGSNGLLTNIVPLSGNRVRYEWKSRFPIAYYLISFAVGDYMDYSFYVKEPGSNDSILVQNYIYNDSSYLDVNKEYIDKTGELMLLYSTLFGPYPFKAEKYGHCVAPFSGGMEHQTMTTLVSFSFLLVAHELAHQWFGDHVTCSTWQDIWINEGFASYGEYLANQYLVSQTDADEWITSTNDYVRSLSGGSVFVPAIYLDNEGRIFDSRLSYKKGASIIHMLRHEIGNDTAFFECLSSYLQKFGNGNASGNDFKEHVEEKTGRDFDQFFNQWYYGEGFPTHNISWEHRNDTLYISSLQTTSSETSYFNVLIDFRITGADVDTIVSFRQDAGYSEWQMYIPGNITMIRPDPENCLLIDIASVSNIEDSIGKGFRILPNPAKDKVSIRLDNPVSKYSLYLANTEGQILTRIESSGQNEEIDVRRFPSGMYFVIIRYGQTTRYGKFIVN